MFSSLRRVQFKPRTRPVQMVLTWQSIAIAIVINGLIVTHPLDCYVSLKSLCSFSDASCNTKNVPTLVSWPLRHILLGTSLPKNYPAKQTSYKLSFQFINQLFHSFSLMQDSCTVSGLRRPESGTPRSPCWDSQHQSRSSTGLLLPRCLHCRTPAKSSFNVQKVVHITPSTG